MRTLVILGILLVAPASRADRPHYTRTQDLHLNAKPPAARLALPRPAPPSRPVTADEVLAGQLRVEPIRQEQESMLLQLIRDTPDSDPDKPEYLFRLAEQYAQQLRLWRLRAVELAQ